MSWRESEAAQLEVMVAELDRAHEELLNAEQVLDQIGSTAGAAELRAALALLRSEINTLNTRARALRRTGEAPQFPMSITSRRAAR